MVMRWNEEEEVGRRCVVDGVVIVGVDGVDGIVVVGVFVLGLLAVASLITRQNGKYRYLIPLPCACYYLH